GAHPQAANRERRGAAPRIRGWRAADGARVTASGVIIRGPLSAASRARNRARRYGASGVDAFADERALPVVGPGSSSCRFLSVLSSLRSRITIISAGVAGRNGRREACLSLFGEDSWSAAARTPR